MSKKLSKAIKDAILDDYYSGIYPKYLYSRSLQACGSRYTLKNIRNCILQQKHKEFILEIGAGKGELLGVFENNPAKHYVCLDSRVPASFAYGKKITQGESRISHVLGDAENLPFKDSEFDLSVSTCVLHHLDDPIAAILELWRVTKHGGKIIIGMPTDPHLLNQLVKRVVSYPRLRKLGVPSPNLIYALEHRNHARAILIYLGALLGPENVKSKFKPFFFASLDLNLQVLAVCTVNKEPGNRGLCDYYKDLLP